MANGMLDRKIVPCEPPSTEQGADPILVEHGLTLATRDRRAERTHRLLGVDFLRL